MVSAHHVPVDASISVRRRPRIHLGNGVPHNGPPGPGPGGDDGEVLFAEYPNRLTYLLAAGPEQPEAYVTWEVRECGAGAIVRLSVDEADTTSEEVEAAWQPVVTKLQALLSAPYPVTTKGAALLVER